MAASCHVPLLFASIVATVLALYWGYTSQCLTTSPPGGQLHTGYLEYECAGKPHHASWESWWHPQRNDGDRAAHTQDAGTTDRDWNILYHLGGNGPWVEKVVDVVDGGIAIPEGCEVEQVHMVGPNIMLKGQESTDIFLQMSRHAERYPTKTAGKSKTSDVSHCLNTHTVN
jgi:hypothetical protein